MLNPPEIYDIMRLDDIFMNHTC